MQRNTGDSSWSFIASCPEEVEQFFQQTVENREEGIILKDLDSKWEPSDRSGKWLKLKPDYVHTGSDLDVLIIGGYYGSGRRGGQVAQFLLGIAEPPKAGQCPTRFFSFCKVGTGLTDEESDHLVQKLRPYFRRYEKNTKPPSCYIVTNNAKERPDVWIDQPDKSVILEITSDIRTIKTEVFAAPYGLRFPRVHKVRYEKPWYDCLDVQALVDMVHSRSGSKVDSKQFEEKGNKEKQSKRQKKPEARFLPLVPSHMRVTDVRHVKRATQIFDGLVFYFANYSEEFTKESLHKLVVENGGTFSMNLNDEITHALACEKKGIKYLASASHGDVIHYSWIMDCCTTKILLPVRPKYFLHLSTQTKTKMKAEIDDYGDDYFVDIDSNDLKQLFENIELSRLATENDELAHYKKKYCPSSTFSQFRNCNFYFHKPIHSRNIDSQLIAETALMRQSLEVSMYEGMVSETLTSDVTHMIVYTSPNHSLSFKSIFKSIAPGDKRVLMSDKLKVISHHWIDDHVAGTYGHPAEAKYNLRDPSFVYADHDMDVEKQLGGNENSGCGRSTDMTEADSKMEVDEEGTAGNEGVPPPTGSLSPRGVPKSSNRLSPKYGINEEKPAKATDMMEIDNGTNANQRVTRNRLVSLPKVSRSSKRRNANHRINEEKPEELDRPVKRGHSEADGCVTSWDVSKAGGSTEVDINTTRDQETPRARLITLSEVPRSSKRRKSNLRIKEINPAGDNTLGTRESRSVKLGHQVIQDPLHASCARGELASETENPSDPKASRIWEPTESSRGSSTSKEAEVDCMLDATDFFLDGMLGDLIPTYNSTQQQPPIQRTSTEEKPPASETTLPSYPLIEPALRDSHLTCNPENVVVSLQDAGTETGVKKSVLDNVVTKADTDTDTVVSIPVRKKKVSYKNIVSNLLNNPP